MTVLAFGDVLEDVHVVSEADCSRVGELRWLGGDKVVPAAPGLAPVWH